MTLSHKALGGANRNKWYMNGSGSAGNLHTNIASLPIRKGKRPITVRGPLHLQCSDNRDNELLRELVQEVEGWTGVEANPLPAGGGEVVSLKIEASLASHESSRFITGHEFARIFLGVPTIYLALPLSCAHWTIVRGWAEPHFSGSFGLMPPGVMVVYTPRDEIERDVCRSLFLISYYDALSARSVNIVGSHPIQPGAKGDRRVEEVVAAA